VIPAAKAYLAAKRIIRREPLYSANRFVRLIGVVTPEEVTTIDLDRYRQICQGMSLSPRTIESSVSDLIAIVEHSTGRRPLPGQRMRLNHPEPSPVPISDVNAMWQHCCGWLKNWIVLTYWTGLRLTDGMDVLVRHGESMTGETINRSANKTRRRHCYPLPAWLPVIWTAARPPWQRSTDFWRKTLRHAITVACEQSGVPIWTPKQLRQRSITEWSRANATAGTIVHGCGLGVLSHYLDPLQILESAAPRVRLPECFGASAGSGEESLVTSFRRCDPAAQSLIVGTAERLAAG
jgi:hypothetical protein